MLTLLLLQRIQSCCSIRSIEPGFLRAFLRPWRLLNAYFITSSETKAFWRTSSRTQGSQSACRLDTTLRPMAKTERKIQELGRYLRSYCHNDQHSWSRFLLWAEYSLSEKDHHRAYTISVCLNQRSVPPPALQEAESPLYRSLYHPRGRSTKSPISWASLQGPPGPLNVLGMSSCLGINECHTVVHSIMLVTKLGQSMSVSPPLITDDDGPSLGMVSNKWNQFPSGPPFN
ncbi:TBC1 domain family member 3B [Labeo rohita]|uniref:TBC1 domain family member 3B n=1 Tax=Labeo rohita TaxID=84645 RepID=A0ABQ8LYG7_LABRO|nr:TBC1 domain family member 3B [Labeo rohita]